MKEKLVTLLLLVGLAVWTQEVRSEESEALLTENLKMRFDFENVSGTSVKDDISGITAKTVGAAKVVEMGDFHVLDLATPLAIST
jgi:hypothetical protein